MSNRSVDVTENPCYPKQETRRIHLSCVFYSMNSWKKNMISRTSHPASKASLKNPSEIVCLAADSESLICDSQYDADDRTLNFLLFEDLETSETGVSFFGWPLTDLFALASEIGLIVPTDLGTGLTVDLTGIESLLGGFPNLSFPERSRTLALLLTLDAGLPLKDTSQEHLSRVRH